MLNGEQLDSIGFSYIKNKLEPSSPYGAELVIRPKFYALEEHEALVDEFSRVGMLMKLFQERKREFEKVERALMYFKDVRRSLERTMLYTLSDVELFEIKRFLIGLERLVPAYDALIKDYEIPGIELQAFPEALDIVDPDGMRIMTFRVSDRYSPELESIRAERRKIDIALRSARTENMERLNAAITELAAREDEEELRVREMMTKRLSAYADGLLRITALLGILDFAMAKARLAVSLGGIIPEVTMGGRLISVTDMVNPRIADGLAERGRSFTPVSISLGVGSTVITGANMGGKSVTVKTLALCAALAHAGMPVFAREAELPMLFDIELLCEDNENSEAGLSSFGGEMIRFNEIITKPRHGLSLVLIDEFARGTNPHEGAALARAAVKFFNNSQNAFALLTTHFDNVSSCALAHYQVMGLKNADVRALERAMAAGGNRAVILEKFMDYGVYPVAVDANPPHDALTVCRVLNVDEAFMSLIEA